MGFLSFLGCAFERKKRISVKGHNIIENSSKNMPEFESTHYIEVIEDEGSSSSSSKSNSHDIESSFDIGVGHSTLRVSHLVSHSQRAKSKGKLLISQSKVNAKT